MYSIDNEKFGKFLTEIRKEKAMTQKELAEKLFVSDKTVSKWERGNSLPNITLLIPIADVLGVTVSELLRGEKLKDETQTDADGIQSPADSSLDAAVCDSIRRRKKNWKIAYLLAIYIVAAEIIFTTLSHISVKQMGDSLLISAMMLLFAGWLCIFAKDALPSYYDKDKINFVSQGIFRIHMVGLSFHNGNWSHILTVFRIFTLTCSVLLPLLCFISISIGGAALWDIVKTVSISVMLVVLLITTYAVGKKYE